ncbi:MAG: EthD family reductase [Pseudonocardiaceae bacterium]|nr:EthD family reductase [Pseudonocardiaceae bacterium]
MTIVSYALLTRRADVPVQDFRRHWQEVHAPLVSELPGLTAYVQHLPVAVEPPPPYDGVAELWFEDLDALRAAARSAAWAEMRADESRFIDRQRTAGIAVAPSPVPVPDPRPVGGVGLLGVMHRRPDLTRPAYLEHWRGRHGTLAARLPGLRAYVHGVPVDLGSDPPFDGVSHLWFDTIDELRAAFHTGVGREVRADEGEFVDATRSFALLLHEHAFVPRPS